MVGAVALRALLSAVRPHSSHTVNGACRCHAEQNVTGGATQDAVSADT